MHEEEPVVVEQNPFLHPELRRAYDRLQSNPEHLAELRREIYAERNNLTVPNLPDRFRGGPSLPSSAASCSVPAHPAPSASGDRASIRITASNPLLRPRPSLSSDHSTEVEIISEQLTEVQYWSVLTATDLHR